LLALDLGRAAGQRQRHEIQQLTSGKLGVNLTVKECLFPLPKL
jgi:hypothetical protein